MKHKCYTGERLFHLQEVALIGGEQLSTVLIHCLVRQADREEKAGTLERSRYMKIVSISARDPLLMTRHTEAPTMLRELLALNMQHRGQVIDII
jgi:hypothetical protein